MKYADSTEALWADLFTWLCSTASDCFVDTAAMGELPAYEADEILSDYGITPSPYSRRRLGQLVNEEIISC